MASRRMTFTFFSNFKHWFFVVFVFIVLIFVLKTTSWYSLQVTDVDHGPSPSGELIPVTVAVFYETLCPDSKSFVLKQLRPAMKKASRLINAKLVPYGKASTYEDEKKISFKCQHGPVECYGNKVHACGVAKISDQKTQVEYVSCMIQDNYDPEAAGRRCAAKFNIEWEPINACSKSIEGAKLLKQMGDLTHDLKPAVSFIPTVTLDGSRMGQAAILKNLLKEVCSHFKTTPEECADLAS